MPLDSRYIIASDLQSYFVDKDTGLPLTGGIITFYKDQARTEAKDIFELSGSPPNYSYTNLGNIMVLSGVGTMQNADTGQDIIPYYFPYDSEGNVELYYVTCYSADGILQWTREGWPNFINTASSETDFRNYIPNGQFLFHNNVPLIETTKVAGEITEPVTPLAQGGWTFERPLNSTAKDIVLFQPFDSFETNPSASPQYSIQISNETPNAGDGYKDLRIKFTDVNKFASATQKYTFAFTGKSNTGSSLSVSLILIKNFGTNGSATTETPIANLTMPSSFTIVPKSGFIFGSNAGKAIGDGSYLQLAIRFPTDSVFDASLTDFILTPEAVDINSFPQTTDGEFSNQALIAPAPTPNGNDLYLPLQLTALGLRYDNSEIGDVIAESQLSNYINSLHSFSNRLLADGKQYEQAAYSALGIPFARLAARYWDSTRNVYLYGTGTNYFTGWYAGTGNELVVTNNDKGAVTDASANTSGFTVANVAKGSDYHTKAYRINTNTFWLENLEVGTVTLATAQTSGFTITSIQKSSETPLLPEITAIQVTVATALAGKFFNFDAYHSAADVPYYVWFKVDGTGTDPAPASRTGIEIDLNSTDTTTIVAEKIREALNGWQVTSIKTVAASAIAGGAYWTINSSGTTPQSYYIWYKKDGVGIDPALSGKTGIQVDIVTADTNAQVAIKTQQKINQKYFASPDLRGTFLRGMDNGAGVDPETATRYSLVPGIIGDMLGTLQNNSNLQHVHQYQFPANVVNSGGANTGNDGTGVLDETTAEGGYESRPINKYVNYVIKY